MNRTRSVYLGRSACHWFAMALLIVALPLVISCNRSQSGSEEAGDKPPASQSGQAGTVSLVIELGEGGSNQFPKLNWKQGQTVLDLMKQAKEKSEQAGLKFEYKGSGETAFLTSIGDSENEGGGAEKKNWQFWVNGKRADRSFGVYELQSSDKVIWKFVPFDVKP